MPAYDDVTQNWQDHKVSSSWSFFLWLDADAEEYGLFLFIIIIRIISYFYFEIPVCAISLRLIFAIHDEYSSIMRTFNCNRKKLASIIKKEERIIVFSIRVYLRKYQLMYIFKFTHWTINHILITKKLMIKKKVITLARL